MGVVKKRLKDLVRPAFFPMARSKAKRLREAGGTVTGCLERALLRTVNRDLTPEEELWIVSIEALRKEMQASSATVQITDYGTGSQTERRSGEEMERGVTEVRKVRDICRGASNSFFWDLFLFQMVREMKPARCVELGTSLGLSAAYQGAALKLNGRGELVTLEGVDSLASIAEENLSRLRLDNVRVVRGRFLDVLPQVLADRRPVNQVFVDGHHEERATLGYFEMILPFLANKAVLAFDDVSWTKGMRRAWSSIRNDGRINAAVSLHKLGIAVIDGGVREKHLFHVPLV